MRSCLAVFAGLLFTLAVSAAFIAEDEPLKALLAKLDKFRTDYPQEKVHLHLDKPFYAIGDDIWFKAYVIDAASHQGTELSRIFNVELINEQDSIQQSLRLPLTSGVAWGDFRLPDSLREGNYRIRAYTNYMRNFGTEYFFDQTIMIGNALSSAVITTVNYQYEVSAGAPKVNATINYADMDGGVLAGKEVAYEVQLDLKNVIKGKAVTDGKGDMHISFPGNVSGLSAATPGNLHTVLHLDKQKNIVKNFPIKPSANETDIQFFPEGGSQVDGIRSKVAFKVVGADGLGKVVSGYVVNSSGDKVLDFKSEHAGMGSFVLQPVLGQIYTAVVKFPDGSEKKIGLPKAQPEGFVLSAGNADSTDLLVKISASPAMLARGGELILVAQSNSVVKLVSKNKLDKAVFNASIPKSRFPTGILQLTLFDQQNQPVAERLVFINHNDLLNVSVNGPKTSGPRQKVKLDLDVKDPEGKPAFCSFSVSVTDAAKVPVDVNDETTIVSNLLLSSDLKGYIEQPNYYFNAIDEQKIHSLDNLLLTQGWRRFAWKNILADNFPSLRYKPEDGLSISGQITQGKKPVAGGKVTLLSPKAGMFILDTLTDADGRFAFKDLIFPDSTKFIIQSRTAKEKKFVDVHLDSVPPLLVTPNKNTPDVQVNVNKSLFAYLKNNQKQFDEMRRLSEMNKSRMLAEVKIVEHTIRTVKGSANLAGHADYIVPGEDLQSCVNVIDCLQGRVPGLSIIGGVPFLMRNMTSSFKGPIPMMVMIDGYPASTDLIESLSPAEVEGVEVLKGATASIYGMRGGGGVLLITTKEPGTAHYYNNYAPGVITYQPKGYYKAREFYAPNYDDPKTNKQKSDLRTTIFWRPNLIVKDGKASFEYFNADSKGPYKVSIEGIDANGNIARRVYNYTVN